METLSPENITTKIEEVKNADAQQVVSWALKTFGQKVALASSFGVEDMVLIDMMVKVDPAANIFTLDTGRLPQETYELIDETIKKYSIRLHYFCPDTKALEKMIEESGPNLFYESVENRKRCCRVRKIDPLNRALEPLSAWICGLRKAQSVTRTDIEKIEVDAAHGSMYKINPLADWTEEDVWDYIKTNNVPYSKLHDKNYPSIGCAPCTKAVKPGEDVRAGRWWWESPDLKECGLHKQ
jgi:phosphoadenosine phosphosulfate reductase